MKQKIFFIINIILLVVVFGLFFKAKKIQNETKTMFDDITQVDSVNKRTTKIYYDQTIQSLKTENKELYDSLKQYEKQLDLVIKLKYENKGEITKVVTNTERDTTRTLETFTYNNNENDSLEYELKIGSYEEPKWYSLKYKVTDNILITNKSEGNMNQMDITTDNGLVTEVDVVKVEEKSSIWDKIAVGPTVGVGYAPISKRVEPFVGVSVTYNLFKKKKKK